MNDHQATTSKAYWQLHAGISPFANALLKFFPANTTIGGIVCPDALAQATMVI